MMDYWERFRALTESHLPEVAYLLAPFAILILGWLVALVVAAVLNAVLKRTDLDNKLFKSILGEETAAGIKPERWISKGAYYLLMLFVLVAFFQSIGLTIVTQPLNAVLIQIFSFAPRLLSAGLLLLLAWVIARITRALVVRMLNAIRADEKLSDSAGLEGQTPVPLSQNMGNAIYWLVFLVFLPGILDALSLEGLLAPVRTMLGKGMAFVPNIFAAGLIMLVGWFAARIGQRIVTNLLAATGLDEMGKRFGLPTILSKANLSGLAGTIVYALVLILVAVAALDALQFAAISQPASQMLAAIFTAIPAIFTAALTILIAYLVGRFAAGLIADILQGMGFDDLFQRLGLSGSAAGQRSPSNLVGYLVLVAVMLFASIEAAGLLGFAGLSQLFVTVTLFAANVGLGAIVFIFGLYLANLFAGMIGGEEGKERRYLRIVVRSGILVLSTAMALQQMGIASEIINLTFGLLLGAAALGIGLSFGLGCRELAAEEVRRWLASIRRDGEK